MTDRIQNYYGQAIRNNNDLESMQKGIWAIFHVIKDETLSWMSSTSFALKLQIHGVSSG